MSALFITLMVTWTDIFEKTGHIFQWIFGGMRKLGHGPNFFIIVFVIGMLTYWILHLVKYKKTAKRNGTIE